MKDLRSRLVRGVPQNARQWSKWSRVLDPTVPVLRPFDQHSKKYYVLVLRKYSVHSIAVRSTMIESPICGILQIPYVPYNTVFFSNDEVPCCALYGVSAFIPVPHTYLVSFEI